MEYKIEKFRELVKTCFDVREYLNRYIELNDEVFHHCPICEGRRTMFVDAENQRFACSNCEHHGDFITLLEYIKNEPLIEILVAIVRNGNISVTETDKVPRKKKRYLKEFQPVPY